MKKMILLLSSIVLMASCAKTPDFPLDEVVLISFHDWLGVNAPKAEKFNAEGDIYIQYFKRGEVMPDSLKIKNDLWIYVKYTGYRLDGTVFVTRDSTISHIAGTWVNSTHWVDDFKQYSDFVGAATICNGVAEVLPSLNKGDKVRIFLSKGKAFESAIDVNEGYKGETSDYFSFPCYMDVELGSVLSNPRAAQTDTIRTFAKNKWGKSINDTVFAGVYMKKIKDDPTGDPIGNDSTAKVMYMQTFLDGFYIKSTSDSLAKVYGRYENTARVQNVYPVKPSDENSSTDYPAFFKKAVKHMRKGEIAQFVVSSALSLQGELGDFSGKPQILPYTPTIYTIRILKDNEVKYQEKL